jgi:MoaA/NifB/PqqE/SkfB family radical SAM enzyme
MDNLTIFKESIRTFDPSKELPAGIVINLTNRCNLACDMCIQYGDGYKNNSCGELPIEAWAKLIEEIHWFNPRITLLGGEPLIYPAIRDLLRLLKSYKLKTELVTNGYFLDQFLDEIFESEIDIFISIDGIPSIHNQIRNSKRSFSRIKETLEIFRNNRSAFNGRYSINSVLLPDNIDTIVDMLQLIDVFEPNLHILQHPMFSSAFLYSAQNTIWNEHFNTKYYAPMTTKKEYDFNSEYLSKVKRLWGSHQEIQNKLNSTLYFSPGLSAAEIDLYYYDPTNHSLHPRRICSRPWRRPSITPDGNVLGCAGYSIGNITMKSFSSIWEGSKAAKLRQVLLGIERFPICTRCCDFYNDRDYIRLNIDHDYM